MSESEGSIKESEGVSSFGVEDTDDEQFTLWQRFRYGTYSYCADLFSYNRGRFYLFVYLIECLFVLSLSFSKNAFWGDWEKHHDFLSVNNFSNFSSGGRNFLFIIAVIYNIVLLGSIILLVKTRASSSKIINLIRFQTIMLPIFYAPFLGILTHTFACDFHSNKLKYFPEVSCSGKEQIVKTVFGVLSLIILVFCGFITAVFDFQWLPSASSSHSVVNPRYRLSVFLLKTIAALYSSFDPGFSDVVVFGILALGNLAIVFYLVCFLPFHRKSSNLILASLFSVSFFTSSLRIISFIIGEQDAKYFIYWGAGIIPVAALVAIICYLRILKLEKLAKNYSAEKEIPFRRSFEVEIGVRFAYHTLIELDLDNAVALFNIGIETFKSPSLFKSFAVFLFVSAKPEDYAIIANVIQRGKRYRPLPDDQYILFCLDKKRKQVLLELDGGSEEIHRKLRQARKLQNYCKKWIWNFWNHLSKNEDLHLLPEIVSAVEINEKKTESILHKLTTKFPRSTRVLRAYAEFLEEIKHEPDEAQHAYRLADELEEERQKRHKKRSKVPHLSQSSGSIGGDSDSGTDYQSEFSEGSRPEEELKRKTKDKRYSLAKARAYKANVERKSSSGVRKLKIGFFITLCLFTLATVLTPPINLNLLSSFKKSITDLDSALTMRGMSALVLLHTRILQQSVLSNNSAAGDFARMKINSSVSTFEKQLSILTSEDKYSKYFLETWETVEWVSSGNRKQLSSSLLDMIGTYVDSARLVGNLDASNVNSISKFRAIQYIFDNGHRIVVNGLHTFCDSIINEGIGSFNSLTKFFYFIATAVSALIILDFLLIILPSVIAIDRDRNDALRLFLIIPKTTILLIKDKLYKESEYVEDDSGIRDFVQATSNIKSRSLIKEIAVRYFSLVLCVFGFAGVVFFNVGIFNIQYSTYGVSMNYANYRRSMVMLTRYFSNELVYNDTVTWYQGNHLIKVELNSTLESLIKYNSLYKFGDGINTTLEAQSSIELEEVFMDVECTLPEGGPCLGTDMAIYEYYQDAWGLMSGPDEITKDNPFLVRINNMQEELLNTLFKNSELMLDIFLKSYNRVLIIVYIFYTLAFLCVQIMYLTLIPLQTKVRLENARTLKMLLMIPMDVIESVPAIREYLENDSTSQSNLKWKIALEEMIGRNKAALDASADAILFCSTGGRIDYVNDATGKLLEYEKDELLGKQINLLMPDQIAKVHDSYITKYLATKKSTIMGKVRELKVKKKHGDLMYVQSWVNSIEIGSKSWFVASFRDIAEIKTYESALQRQKQITDNLLHNVVPPAVASLIENHRGKSDLSNRKFEAEKFEEVSILFADIVQFTKMTSNISPNELIHILNTLVSGWDKACERHGVEKIKTVGDCYIAVCGASDLISDHAERLLEFAIDMLSSLNDFNNEYEYDLKLRVGINVGSIVAGVLGATKLQYDIYGDAVTIASKMESSGTPGKIHVSQAAFDKLQQSYQFEECGVQEVKGTGQMLTYLFKERKFARTASGHVVRKATITPPTMRKRGGISPSGPSREPSTGSTLSLNLSSLTSKAT